MIVLVLLLIFTLYLLTRVCKYYLLSPIYLYVLFALVSIIASTWYFYFFENKFSLFNLDNVSEAKFLEVLRLYIIALVSFIVGVLIYYDVSKKKTKKIFNKSFTDSLFLDYKLNKGIKITGVILFYVIIVLYIITYGKGIFIREEYLPETNRGLTILIKILSFVEVIILGLVYKNQKLASTIYFILLLLISIGTGSRSVFLFFLGFISLVFISNGNTLFNKIRFSIHLVISFLFLAYIMQLRELEMHGVIPYLKSISSESKSFVRSFFFNIYYSFIYGVFVTIKTIQKSELDWNIIFISLNPLPGSMAGWYDYADKMRINIYAPYSLHGRIFKMGYFFTVIYFFLTGVVFSFFERKIRVLLEKKKRVLSFIIVLILMLHIVYAFEYNMRAAIRYIYYAFFILLLVYLTNQILLNLPKRKKENDT